MAYLLQLQPIIKRKRYRYLLELKNIIGDVGVTQTQSNNIKKSC